MSSLTRDIAWYRDGERDHDFLCHLADCCIARIAELEALSATSICVFCGETMEKDLTVMLEHARGCGNRPENRLMGRIAELEAERDKANELAAEERAMANRQVEVRRKAEAEREATRDKLWATEHDLTQAEAERNALNHKWLLRVRKVRAERDALRAVLTPSQRKRFDAQYEADS